MNPKEDDRMFEKVLGGEEQVCSGEPPHVHACACMCMHVHTSAYISIHVHACAYMCIHVQTYAYICNQCDDPLIINLVANPYLSVTMIYGCSNCIA